MIPREILTKVRRIEIRTRRVVRDVFGGDYHSAFKGRGMEFSEVREYVPGDDVRTIDWNVTARTGHPFVKRYQEERELTVLLVVDLSASGRFGTQGRLKAEVAAEAGAVLALAAVQNNDRVGLLLFSDAVERYVPPAKGRRHVLRVVREILYFKPAGRGTNLAVALDHMTRAQKRRAVVFVISDFFDKGFARSLTVASRRHDVAAFRLRDRREETLPRVGVVAMQDLETGREVLVDTSSAAVQAQFARESAQRDAFFRETARKSAIDHADLWTHQDVVDPLAAFFRRRLKRVLR